MPLFRFTTCAALALPYSSAMAQSKTRDFIAHGDMRAATRSLNHQAAPNVQADLQLVPEAQVKVSL
jgi:hypothetical protein